MKNCPKCNAQVEDQALFCPVCGFQFGAQQEAAPNQVPPQQQYNPNQQQYNYAPYPPQAQPQPAFDPFDHTAEFDKQDISDNKVFAMLVYLMGIMGIVVALLASNKSEFTRFHIRQALKFEVCEILMILATAVLFWTFIVPIAVAIMECIFFVLKIICFINICQGKAKEPAIIRNLGFLK